MSEEKKTKEYKDLMDAKAEAKEKMRELSENALEKVNGGRGANGNCRFCGIYLNGDPACPNCNALGDGRDGMNEKFADIDGLMAAVDGFAK